MKIRYLKNGDRITQYAPGERPPPIFTNSERGDEIVGYLAAVAMFGSSLTMLYLHYYVYGPEPQRPAIHRTAPPPASTFAPR